ncbi:hypothetical protein MC885_005455 [Smutsia gigantea]|nr:hypothetical protein MC885_005455 [Smutsia gigantea]
MQSFSQAAGQILASLRALTSFLTSFGSLDRVSGLIIPFEMEIWPSLLVCFCQLTTSWDAHFSVHGLGICPPRPILLPLILRNCGGQLPWLYSCLPVSICKIPTSLCGPTTLRRVHLALQAFGLGLSFAVFCVPLATLSKLSARLI